MTDWIVRSKLVPPIAIDRQVQRLRLCELLDCVLERRLGLVHAPAGYGKSTLLALWRQRLLDKRIPAAWLSVDQYDNSYFNFVSYLIESCREAGFLRGRLFAGVSRDLAALAPAQLNSAFVTALSKCSGKHVVIIDDVHRITDADVSALIAYLVESLPSNIHLVLGTRELPGQLPLANLRMHDDLVQVDQIDLRLDRDEVAEFMGHWISQDEPPSWPDAVLQSTEGWAVALQTLRQWLKEGSTLASALESLTGDASVLSDYFMEQVLTALPEETQKFLLYTSILERVNGDIGNLLCNIQSGWTTLQELERKDLFVTGLDRTRTWFRYHRLFSEFLSIRLSRELGSEVSRLHQQASRWFLNNGFVGEAVNHALNSDDAACKAELIESLGGWLYALGGHMDTVERVLGDVDDAMIKGYPRLWLGRVYLLVRVGEFSQAQAQFSSFEGHYVCEGVSDTLLLAEAGVIAATLDVYGGKPTSRERIAELESLEESIPPDSHLLNAARCNLLCAMYRDVGEFDKCMETGDRAIAHYRATDSVYGETFIYFHEGYACAIQARLRDAEVLYQTARDIAVENFGKNNDLVAIADAYLAEVNYDRNRVHLARRQIDDCLSHIEKFDAWLDVYVAAYSTAMRLELSQNNAEGLRRVLYRARSTAAHRSLDALRLAMELLYYDCIARLASGGESQVVAARAPEEDRELRSLRFSADLLDLSIARRAWREGNADRAERQLEQAAREAAADKRFRSAINFLVLLAEVRWSSGNKAEAVASFEEAVSLSMFEGIKRPFIDEGRSPGSVIRKLAVAAGQRLGNRLRDSFISELLAEIGSESPTQPRSADSLSPREREVLKFMLQGQSNREIAATVGISINTVKFHVKNLFSKLGASSRKEAIAEAVRRRLI